MPLVIVKRQVFGNIMKEIPIWEKSNLTLEEAAAYSGIGINKIREISNAKDCDFVLWVGNKRLIKRQRFDQFINRSYSI
nr:excisionase [uncultured Cloacibacillus sp.]